MNLKRLGETMPYKTRIGPGNKELAYITARQAQDRLDDVCGPENWKVEYKEIAGNIFAGVSIKILDEWITKWDAGSESNIEKEKGHISDSFKRACVCWGVGRFLYPESEATKTEFTIENLEGLTKVKDSYKNSSQAIEQAKTKYEVSQEMEEKIKLLYNS